MNTEHAERVRCSLQRQFRNGKPVVRVRPPFTKLSIFDHPNTFIGRVNDFFELTRIVIS